MLMLRLLRMALQVVLFFVLLSVVVAVGAQETGLAEKAALIAILAALVWLAARLRQIAWITHTSGMSSGKASRPTTPNDFTRAIEPAE
jgi:hypothetical protein